jgi:hypothetical protein
MEIQKFVRKPFYVDGIQVTEENMEEVAEWCGGKILVKEGAWPNGKYIEVDVQQPMSDRQKMAFVKDWVLYSGSGYKVYTPKAFANVFQAIEGAGSVPPAPSPKQMPAKKPTVSEPETKETHVTESVANPVSDPVSEELERLAQS